MSKTLYLFLIGIASIVVVGGTMMFGSPVYSKDPAKKTTLGDLDCTLDQIAKSTGTDWACANLDGLSARFELRTHPGGQQTVFDNQTKLEWEIKLAEDSMEGDCANPTQALRSIHCVNNTYSWATSGFPNFPPDGPLFTEFLVRINEADNTSANGLTIVDGCLGGHCDWRIPNIAELRTILLEACPGFSVPCIDPIFGPTDTGTFYWSSTTEEPIPDNAWGVSFVNGGNERSDKTVEDFVRAVRGGR